VRILLIDNYDSFTHNLAQLVAAESGELPRVVRNDAAPVEELLAWRPDAVILSPGPGTPERAADVGVCPALVERLHDTPLLGVCLGHQVIGVAHGARVVRAPEPMHGRCSTVRHDGTGLFVGIADPLEVVRYHSLVLDAASLPESLHACAHSDDGVVMAIAHRTRPLFGVQFHPESILAGVGQRVVANFLARVPRRPRPTAVTMHARNKSMHARTNNARMVAERVPYLDAERAFLALYRDAPLAFWLDGEPAGGRFSYLGAGSEVLRADERGVARRTASASEPLAGDPFDVLACMTAPTAPRAALPFELSSGWVGWLGYEASRHADPSLRAARRADAALPEALLMRADRVLAFDHARRELMLCCSLGDGERDADAARWFADTAARLRDAPPLAPLAQASAGAPRRFRLDRGRARYLDDVARIVAHLRAGDAYEVCLTAQARATRAGGDPHPLDLHRVLRRSNPAPYSAYLRFPEATIVSASPERFVHVAADGSVESRPIKGTRRRGSSDAEDAAARAALAASVKDRAENLMIVDLVRNDLGRVCAPGSIHVPELMAIEPHPTVFQMVSTVRGRLADGFGPLDAVRALFPGGSMTGAPKLRAMAILDQLEGRPRGVYAGGVGFVSSEGVVDLAMAIRTFVITADEIAFGVGGAVTALSDPEAELDEAIAKGAALVHAFSLAAGAACELVAD
jgi:para-aminobenzoate synthetase